MTDSPKNNVVVVVLVLLAIFAESTLAFTQELQQYTDEITKRSFGLISSFNGMFDMQSWPMVFATAVYTIVNLCVVIYTAFDFFSGGWLWLSSMFGASSPLGLGHMPTEMTTAKNGETRDQRVLNVSPNTHFRLYF